MINYILLLLSILLWPSLIFFWEWWSTGQNPIYSFDTEEELVKIKINEDNLNVK